MSKSVGSHHGLVVQCISHMEFGDILSLISKEQLNMAKFHISKVFLYQNISVGRLQGLLVKCIFPLGVWSGGILYLISSSNMAKFHISVLFAYKGSLKLYCVVVGCLHD